MSNFQDDIFKIKIQLKTFKLSQMYNIDESALFYQLLPNKTIGSSNFKDFKQHKI